MSDRKPVWNGPLKDGITFSLLSKWLVCRERFRLMTIEGLKEDEGFNHAIEYGNLWHGAEEASANGQDPSVGINREASRLMLEYPTAEREINKWAGVCRIQFPQYIRYHKLNSESRIDRYFMAEKSFRIPYRLPSGRIITIRGKIDGGLKRKEAVYIQENKSKGTIDEEGISKTVHRNFQAMLYFVMFNIGTRLPHTAFSKMPPASGIVYNVIRRPLSDHHAIRQKKNETEKQFLDRLGEQIKANPRNFFMRWYVPIRKKYVDDFKLKMFHPILESFLDWWESIEEDPFNPWITRQSLPAGSKPNYIPNRLHYEYPHGIYNSIFAGYRGDFFDYLATGSERGLIRVKSLYPELAEPAAPKKPSHPVPRSRQ